MPAGDAAAVAVHRGTQSFRSRWRPRVSHWRRRSSFSPFPSRDSARSPADRCSGLCPFACRPVQAVVEWRWSAPPGSRLSMGSFTMPPSARRRFASCSAAGTGCADPTTASAEPAPFHRRRPLPRRRRHHPPGEDASGQPVGRRERVHLQERSACSEARGMAPAPRETGPDGLLHRVGRRCRRRHRHHLCRLPRSNPPTSPDVEGAERKTPTGTRSELPCVVYASSVQPCVKCHSVVEQPARTASPTVWPLQRACPLGTQSS